MLYSRLVNYKFQETLATQTCNELRIITAQITTHFALGDCPHKHFVRLSSYERFVDEAGASGYRIVSQHKRIW